MKQYERLGLDIDGALKWIAGCRDRACSECPADGPSIHGCSAAKCAAEYLNAEVPEKPKVPRVALIQTQEELNNAGEEFRKICIAHKHCVNCPYINKTLAAGGIGPWMCFFAYMSELVEAPDE